jgi:hypothetical protein
MSNAVSMLEQLQSVALGALQASPWFDGTMSANGTAIPIVIERKNDIGTQIETALGQVGICALITTPTFEFFNEQLYELSGWADLMVDVLENVPANQAQAGTQIRAITLASNVIAVLHRFETGLATGPTNRPPSFIGLKKPLALGSLSPVLSYTASFQAHVLLP